LHAAPSRQSGRGRRCAARGPCGPCSLLPCGRPRAAWPRPGQGAWRAALQSWGAPARARARPSCCEDARAPRAQVLPADYYKEWLRLPYLTILAVTLGVYWAHPCGPTPERWAGRGAPGGCLHGASQGSGS